jgi:2-phosphosulfolactate phosphatase
MRIDVHFTLPEVDPAALAESTAVVIDVLRATTTIVEALANGAGGVYPTTSAGDAAKLAASLGREDTLLCGEQKGLKVDGFDLGNSPAEFVEEIVAGKKLVMSTSNGTRALSLAAEAQRVLVCAFTNLGAVARAVASDEVLTVLCAGRADQFAVDDALCAGHLVNRIVEDGEGLCELNDAARAARAFAKGLSPDRAFLDGTAAGRALAEVGLADDLDLCGEVDRHDVVPVMLDQAITLSGAR